MDMAAKVIRRDDKADEAFNRITGEIASYIAAHPDDAERLKYRRHDVLRQPRARAGNSDEIDDRRHDDHDTRHRAP